MKKAIVLAASGAALVAVGATHEVMKNDSAEVNATVVQAADPGSSIVSAAVPDVACDPAAVPTLAADTDSRVVEAMKSNFASQASPPREALTRNSAIDMARGFSTDKDKSALSAAAVEVPYSLADSWLGGTGLEDSLVAPTRCVWVVTVVGSYEPRRAPDPTVRGSYKLYTATFDERSGQYLGLSAGSEAVNLITGDTLAR